MASLLSAEARTVLLRAHVLRAVASTPIVRVHTSAHLYELGASPFKIFKPIGPLMIMAICASAVVWIATFTTKKAFAICLRTIVARACASDSRVFVSVINN